MSSAGSSDGSSTTTRKTVSEDWASYVASRAEAEFGSGDADFVWLAEMLGHLSHLKLSVPVVTCCDRAIHVTFASKKGHLKWRYSQAGRIEFAQGHQGSHLGVGVVVGDHANHMHRQLSRLL